MKDKVVVQGTFYDGKCIRFSSTVKNVGVWLDEHLNMKTHINKIVSHCHKLLKDIGRVRRLLDVKHTEMLVHPVISSRLDYCNSLFYNMSKDNLNKLQKVLNAAARLISGKRKRESVKATLKELHWLPVESRILFKILLIVYKSIKGMCSANLRLPYKGHNCRSDDFLMLETFPVKTKYGKRSYGYAGPRLWNALPVEVRMVETVEEFKRKVKTILFRDTEGFKRRAFRYEV